MGRKMLTVKRCAHTRKDGTRVRATTYKVLDRGRKGRGPETIKIEKEGALGGPGYADRSPRSRHRLLNSSVGTSGYPTTARRIAALRGLGKRTMSRGDLRVLKQDQEWLKDKYGNKRKKNRKKR